jgi:HipA-like protein
MKKSPASLAAINARKAEVRLEETTAGYLEMVATDEFRFTYAEEYLRAGHHNPALSLTLPFSKSVYTTTTLHPFFDNLLFEGELLRYAEKAFAGK